MNKVKSTKYVCPVCDGVLWTTTTHDKLKCDDCDRTFLAPQTATDALRKPLNCPACGIGIMQPWPESPDDDPNDFRSLPGFKCGNCGASFSRQDWFNRGGAPEETKTDEEISHDFAVNISNIGLLDHGDWIAQATKQILAALRQKTSAIAPLIEENALLKSQIENHDAMLEQVRLNCESKAKRELAPLIEALLYAREYVNDYEEKGEWSARPVLKKINVALSQTGQLK